MAAGGQLAVWCAPHRGWRPAHREVCGGGVWRWIGLFDGRAMRMCVICMRGAGVCAPAAAVVAWGGLGGGPAGPTCAGSLPCVPRRRACLRLMSASPPPMARGLGALKRHDAHPAPAPPPLPPAAGPQAVLGAQGPRRPLVELPRIAGSLINAIGFRCMKPPISHIHSMQSPSSPFPLLDPFFCHSAHCLQPPSAARCGASVLSPCPQLDPSSPVAFPCDLSQRSP